MATIFCWPPLFFPLPWTWLPWQHGNIPRPKIFVNPRS
jgi:hypothetical protein